MLDYRLTYTVSAPDLIDFDRCQPRHRRVHRPKAPLHVKVKIPVPADRQAHRRLLTGRPLTGHIDFVPARDESEDKGREREGLSGTDPNVPTKPAGRAWTRVGAVHLCPTRPDLDPGNVTAVRRHLARPLRRPREVGPQGWRRVLPLPATG
jgi:hypothetical protein